MIFQVFFLFRRTSCQLRATMSDAFRKPNHHHQRLFSSLHVATYLNMYICVCFFFFCPSGELTRSLARSPVCRQILRAKEEISFSSDAVFLVVCLFWIVSRNHFTADVCQRGKTTPTPLSNNTSVKLSPVLIIYVINTNTNTKSKQVVFFRCSHRSCVCMFFLSLACVLFFSTRKSIN